MNKDNNVSKLIKNSFSGPNAFLDFVECVPSQNDYMKQWQDSDTEFMKAKNNGNTMASLGLFYEAADPDPVDVPDSRNNYVEVESMSSTATACDSGTGESPTNFYRIDGRTKYLAKDPQFEDLIGALNFMEFGMEGRAENMPMLVLTSKSDPDKIQVRIPLELGSPCNFGHILDQAEQALNMLPESESEVKGNSTKIAAHE